MVSALDVKSEGRGFDAQSMPSCCFLGLSLHPSISMGTGDILLGVTTLSFFLSFMKFSRFRES